MSGGFSSKRNMANGRMGIGLPTPRIMGSKTKNIQRRQIAKQKEPKMSFRSRLREWLFAEDNDNEYAEMKFESDESNEVAINEDNAIHFAVIPANGGRIVQLRYFDRVKDRHFTKLHLVTPDENLAEALAHILQIEVISR